MNTSPSIIEKAKEAKLASFKLSNLSSDIKNNALKAIAKALHLNSDQIIAANLEDYKRSQKEKISAPLLKRLKFDSEKINQVIDGLKSLVDLEDPCGKIELAEELDKGLDLYKVSVPIGVVGIIFESRPDALVQISSLCLKSGNTLLLKGGSEAQLTNKTLYNIIKEASLKEGIPGGWIQLVETREDVNSMFALNQYIDLLIPRGSNSFVKYIMDHSSIPVLGHSDGICHIFADKTCDFEQGIKIINDSKTQYVAACNTLETLLVHKDIAEKFLPLVQRKLEPQVELRGCQQTCQIIDVKEASSLDWATEYVDYILSIKVVSSLEEGVSHINYYGSGHTDVILTQKKDRAKSFMAHVDSACTFWNCSTRFSDGFRFGFGAEIGISTSKIHARGPVGLEGLMIYKYKLLGGGQIVDDYAKGNLKFSHKRIENDRDKSLLS